MTLRACLFWCHLACGVVAGVVILIMCVTGALLTYEKQVVAWADTRHYKVAPPSPAAPRLSMEALIAKAHEAEPRTTFATATARADAAAPVAVAAGQRTLYINPYDGSVMGEGAAGVRRFFRTATDWHRTLAFTGEQRPIGRAVTGACNLMFLFIVSSGIYLWWPRTWTRGYLRTVTLFKGGLRGKARDFNWHNVIGFWSAIPLLVIVFGSVVMSYAWANDMLYRLAGEPPPARPGSSPPAQRETAEAMRRRGTGRGNRSGSGDAEKPPTTGLDAGWTRAEQQVPGWRSISVRLPTVAESPLIFTIDEGTGGQPQKRGTLTLKRSTAEIERWEPFANLSPGRRLRSWFRFAHTGEVYGLWGQTIAGLASTGGAVLVCTGLALAIRRLFAWQERVRNARRAGDSARV
jgi:uncharacterized iron-regulated membrane protein